MPSYNRCLLVGNVVAPIRTSETSGGKEMGHLRVAVQDSWKQGNEWKKYTNFFSVAVFYRNVIEKFSSDKVKGKPVLIEGKLTARVIEEDGKKRTQVEITASKVVLLARLNAADNEEVSSGGDSFPEDNLKDDEVPF